MIANHDRDPSFISK